MGYPAGFLDPSPGAGAVQRLREGPAWHRAALAPLPLLWLHIQLSAPPDPIPAALPAPPPAQLAEQDSQFIVSSLLLIFSAASSAGLYLINYMDNLQLSIQHVYLFSHYVADPKFPSSSEFLHSSHCPSDPWQSQGVAAAGVSSLPGLGLHTSIARAHWEGTCGNFVLK